MVRVGFIVEVDCQTPWACVVSRLSPALHLFPSHRTRLIKPGWSFTNRFPNESAIEID